LAQAVQLFCLLTKKVTTVVILFFQQSHLQAAEAAAVSMDRLAKLVALVVVVVSFQVQLVRVHQIKVIQVV
jgi:hypothetical protein